MQAEGYLVPTEEEETRETMGAETEASQLQDEMCWEPTEAGRSKNLIVPGAYRGITSFPIL